MRFCIQAIIGQQFISIMKCYQRPGGDAVEYLDNSSHWENCLPTDRTCSFSKLDLSPCRQINDLVSSVMCCRCYSQVHEFSLPPEKLILEVDELEKLHDHIFYLEARGATHGGVVVVISHTHGRQVEGVGG